MENTKRKIDLLDVFEFIDYADTETVRRIKYYAGRTDDLRRSKHILQKIVDQEHADLKQKQKW